MSLALGVGYIRMQSSIWGLISSSSTSVSSSRGVGIFNGEVPATCQVKVVLDHLTEDPSKDTNQIERLAVNREDGGNFRELNGLRSQLRDHET